MIKDRETDYAARSTHARIGYLAVGSSVNRRFVAAGAECNTGAYEEHEVIVRDGRDARERFRLDTHGFALLDHRSAVADFRRHDEVERLYPAEAAALVRRATGADEVIGWGWMVRSAGDLATASMGITASRHRHSLQPPACEAHVDFAPATAHRIAEQAYQQAHPEGLGFRRFIAFSLWRVFSPPPQDWPLAVCDGRSLADDEGVPNTLHVVDEMPSPEARMAAIAGQGELMAASVFRYNPAHQWWYFRDMTADEALLFKFYDSDHAVTWRCPHTAFHDGDRLDARPRESIEARMIAYFR